jgi:menaquinone-dependent protoporphyrinogen oxidase
LVLVACATKYGATEGVAERIAAKLAEHGLSVEARRMDAVRDAGAYDVFVVGSAVYIGSWPKDAVQFVERNRPVLSISDWNEIDDWSTEVAEELTAAPKPAAAQ